MAVVLLVVRVFLSALLVAAGAAKARDPEGTAAAVIGFGLPARMARPLARALPVVELALAAALLPATTAPTAAAAVAALLAVFSLLVARAVVTGRAVDCHCFGAASAHPVGPRTLLRNAVLLSAAATVAWSPGGPPLPLPTALAPPGVLGVAAAVGLVLLIAAVAVQSWFLVRLYGQQGRLLARIGLLEGALVAPVRRDAPREELPGLPVGAPAPTFALTGTDGATATLEGLRSPGRPLVLVFSAPSCAACMVLEPDLVAFAAEHRGRVTVAVVSAGSLRAVATTAGGKGLHAALADTDRAVATAYGAEGTPAAVLVEPDGTIGSPLALGPAAVKGLLERVAEPDLLPLARSPRRHAHGLVSAGVGTVAPVVGLPTPAGVTAHVGGATERDTVLVFWDPDCGYCGELLPRLRAWWQSEPGHPAAQRPDVTIVSVRAPAVGELHPDWRVVVDEQRVAMGAHGARGTPTGVLVDRSGRIVSDVAVGVTAVLDLARDAALTPAGRR